MLNKGKIKHALHVNKMFHIFTSNRPSFHVVKTSGLPQERDLESLVYSAMLVIGGLAYHLTQTGHQGT